MHTESPVGHALTSAAVETPAFVIDDAKLAGSTEPKRSA